MKRFLQFCVIEFLRLFAKRIFPGLVRLLALFIPPSKWYTTVLHLSRVQAAVVHIFRKHPKDKTTVARIMDRWFEVLATTNRAFPIPLKFKDAETFMKAAGSRSGVIVCSAHIPLYRLIGLSLVALDRPPDLLIVKKPEREGRFNIWGLANGLKCAPPSMNILVKVRSILRNGGRIALLADEYIGGPYSPNIFRLARRTHSHLLFCFPELQADGTISVEWVDAPDPFCMTEEGVKRNLQCLDEKVNEIWFGKQAGRVYSPSELAEERRQLIA